MTDVYTLVISDYRALSAALGPLDVASFVRGYVEHAEWIAHREQGIAAAGCDALNTGKGEQHARASTHAA